MASAIGNLITGKLAGLAWDEAALIWTFRDDVDGLKKTMEKLQALMPYADQMESQAEGPRRHIVKNWMEDFKAAAYDVEDLLDEFETTELIKQGQSKIRLFFSYYNPLLLRFTIAHKIKKVKEAITKIETDIRETLGMVPQNTPIWAEEVANNQPTITPTHGDIDITMIGRDIKKEKIMKLLKSEAEEVISIIPIVGLGGMGKTRLAQSIFSDSRTKTFDVRVWVYVSKTFDLQRIGEIILSTVRRNTNNEPSERYIQPKGDLQAITEILETILSAKKYLIILDDMWETGFNKLEKLKQMLKYGEKGSKIILTTRMQHVVDELGRALAGQAIIRLVQKSDQINLSMLSDDDCWNVMQQASFSQDEDLGGLEVIGRQIAKKCAGLPLLARSLGFLLSQYKSMKAWEEIRDKKIILGMKEYNQLQDPLERLMLSYHYMPLKFKLCFTYCAVFPKGFAIASDHLIQQWRALGFIQSSESSYGYLCVKYLLGMSFLQISMTSQDAAEGAEAPIMVTMHDLVYDLATIILDQELMALNDSEQMTRNRLKKHYCRHMQLINYQNQSNGLKFPNKIRSVHFTECSRFQLQDKSFSKCKYLRVLDIRECAIQGNSASSNISLPSSIQQLILLRYLDASGLPITSLPKSLPKLQNMQTLILSNCTLETLPDNIGSLVNLCYLDLSGNNNLNRLPMSIGELSALWFLNLSACSKLYELPESIDKLICLQHLDMSGCNALQRLPDKFGSLPKLLFLNLSGCSRLVKLPDSFNLKSLEHLNLSSCHQLQSLPNNFGNLEKIKLINLSDCYKVHVLPESFCQLKHLKNLYLSDCHDLKELPECFGNLSELQSLDVTSCSKLQSLPESFGGLSKLKHLDLSYCVRLENLPSSFCNLKLCVLYMKFLWNLRELPYGIGNMTSLTMFEVYTGNNIDIDFIVASSILRRLQLHERTVKHDVHDVHEVDNGWHSSIVNMGQLACHHLDINQLYRVKHPEDAERAKLRDNPDLRELRLSWNDFLRRPPRAKHHADWTENKRDAEVLENLVPPRTLEGFALAGYRSTNFPNWMLDISSYLPYLTTIKLMYLTCASLPPLGMLPNLRLLGIHEIPNIMKIGKEFYGEEGACKRLRVIQLKWLPSLEEWWTTRSGEEEDEFLIPNLHRLDVNKCPKLKFLPYPPKSMYWDLENSDEVLPSVHGFGRLSSSTLPFEATIRSMSFTVEKWDRLQHLATIEHLILTDYGTSLSSLPEATPYFPSLRRLFLSLSSLEILPECLGQLITLEELSIWEMPNPTYLPQSIRNLTALKRLSIRDCPSLISLPQSIRNLTTLKKLSIEGCPRLVEKCKGEDAHKIFHILEVELDGTRFADNIPLEE